MGDVSRAFSKSAPVPVATDLMDRQPDRLVDFRRQRNGLLVKLDPEHIGDDEVIRHICGIRLEAAEGQHAMHVNARSDLGYQSRREPAPELLRPYIAGSTAMSRRSFSTPAISPTSVAAPVSRLTV